MSINYKEYDPNWAKNFLKIKEKIQPLLSQYIEDFIHVGSTSIKGMSAKPIIDIDIIVKDFNSFDQIKELLSSISYIHKGDLGIKEREAFSQNPPSKIAHNLYVVKKDSLPYKNHLFLKRHLENNPKAFRAYQELKTKLSKSSSSQKEYWKSKTELILSFLEAEGLSGPELDEVRKQNT